MRAGDHNRNRWIGSIDLGTVLQTRLQRRLPGPRSACKLRPVQILAAALLSFVSTASAQREHVVRPGDTLIEIAQRYHVEVAALERANRIRRAAIRPGMRLEVPRPSGLLHRVRSGDSLISIARHYGIAVEALRAANRVRNDLIRPGSELVIPGRAAPEVEHAQTPAGPSFSELHGRTAAAGAAMVPSGPPPRDLDAARERARRLGLGSSTMAHRLIVTPPDAAWIAEAGEPETIRTLLPPLESYRLLRGWGSGANGYHLALDLGAPEGAIVRASGRGLVLYSGRAVHGYGNLVIVLHPNGRTTWYAHNRENLVEAGEQVERGQTIGLVGDTGIARGTHVHFMLVDGTQHCDPAPLFDPPLPGASGAFPGDQEPSIRCAPRREHPHPRRRRHRRARRR
jgi:murein DD-endopeptidase MepM/ murein hydrolase activator NlpD